MRDGHTPQSDVLALERMVDLYGFASVLSTLALIASAKGEHLASNWGEEWGYQRIAERISKLAEAPILRKLAAAYGQSTEAFAEPQP